MFAQLYRHIIPVSLRRKLYKVFLGKLLFICRHWKSYVQCWGYRFHYTFVTPKDDIEKAFQQLGKLGPTAYPYPWIKEYDRQVIKIQTDDQNGLPYVLHHGKRLYFKRSMYDQIEIVYQGLLIEQDKRSAHRYIPDYQTMKGKNLLDVGSAEGIFTLEVIDLVAHAYLFECDDEWVEALEATFRPWKDKVTIVRKYVSDMDDENNTTLDTYLQDKTIQHPFLKMDIEGYEKKALAGANRLLKQHDTSGAVCIYHQHQDEEILSNILKAQGYQIDIQPGYLYFDNEMRHAVMRFHH